MNAAYILRNAFKLEQFSVPDNVNRNGVPVVRLYSNKIKSKKYLIENYEKLRSIYMRIKEFAKQPDSKNYYNALFVCVSINRSLFLLSTSTFEDGSDMVNKILENNSTQYINDWVVNEFYGKIEVPPNLLKKWVKMERSKKIKVILDGLIQYKIEEKIEK